MVACCKECGRPFPKAKREAAQTRLLGLTRELVRVFEGVRRAKYLHGGARDATALKTLLPVATDQEIIIRWGNALKRTAYPTVSTFAQLAQHWNAITGASPRTRGPSDPDAGWRTDGKLDEEAPF
jgi:hypothetical protein